MTIKVPWYFSSNNKINNCEDYPYNSIFPSEYKFTANEIDIVAALVPSEGRWGFLAS